MNLRQRNRLERLEAALGEEYAQHHWADYQESKRQSMAYYAGEGPRPADPPCPPGEDPDFWVRHIRSRRIQERRMWERFGQEERAADILIDPPPTADELCWADGFLDEYRHVALRTLFEEDGSACTFEEWLAERSE